MNESVRTSSSDHKKRIEAHHCRTMTALGAYPTLKQHVFTDKWAKEFLDERLKSKDDMGSFPALYAAADRLRFTFPSNYLEVIESGLAFIMGRRPCKKNLTDLLGNLQHGGAAIAFEPLLAHALVTEFGDGAIEPYPRIGQGSQQTCDFALSVGNVRVLVEATCLFQDKESSLALQNKGGFAFRDDSFYMWRLCRSIAEKVGQRNLESPLLLCVNQQAWPPHPPEGLAAIERLVPRLMRSYLWAIAYFFEARFVGIVFSNNTQCGNTALADRIQKAFSGLWLWTEENQAEL